VLLAAAYLTSRCISEWQSLFQPQKAFFLLPARGWELLLVSEVRERKEIF